MVHGPRSVPHRQTAVLPLPVPAQFLSFHAALHPARRAAAGGGGGGAGGVRLME